MSDREIFCAPFPSAKGWRHEGCAGLGADLMEKAGCYKGLDFDGLGNLWLTTVFPLATIKRVRKDHDMPKNDVS